MKGLIKLMLIVGLAAGFTVMCGEDDPADDGPGDEGEDEGEGGGDGDADGDTDADADGDTDADADGDSDADADGDGCAITADETGWIDASANTCGIQGSWFTYGDGAATINGEASATGGYCASGTTVEAGDDWSNWGAGVGFNLCLDTGGNDDSSDDQELSLGTCTTDLTGLVGFRLTLTGTISSALRVTMSELDRDESAYLAASEAEVGNPVVYMIDDATVAYSADAPPVDRLNVRALQFQVASNQSSPVPFDFCIENIEAIFQ